jgi:hypothetical protein
VTPTDNHKNCLMVARLLKKSYTCYRSANEGTCATRFIYLRPCDNMALRVVWVAIEMLGSRARYPHKRAVLTRYWRQWGGLLLTRRLSWRATLHFTDPYARYQTTMFPMRPVVVESHKITSPRRTHWSRFANEPQVGDHIRGSADRLFCGRILSNASRCAVLKRHDI